VDRRPIAIASDFVIAVSSSLLSSIHLHDGIEYCDVCTMPRVFRANIGARRALRSRAGYIRHYKLQLLMKLDLRVEAMCIRRNPFISRVVDTLLSTFISYTNLNYPLRRSKHVHRDWDTILLQHNYNNLQNGNYPDFKCAL
jgi:hypothetical protein